MWFHGGITETSRQIGHELTVKRMKLCKHLTAFRWSTLQFIMIRLTYIILTTSPITIQLKPLTVNRSESCQIILFPTPLLWNDSGTTFRHLRSSHQWECLP